MIDADPVSGPVGGRDFRLLTLTREVVPICSGKSGTILTLEDGCAVKRSVFAEEQIALALKQAEVGRPVEEVCRRMGFSDATITTGSRCMVGWGRRNCGGLKKRTASAPRWLT